MTEDHENATPAADNATPEPIKENQAAAAPIGHEAQEGRQVKTFQEYMNEVKYSDEESMKALVQEAANALEPYLDPIMETLRTGTAAASALASSENMKKIITGANAFMFTISDFLREQRRQEAAFLESEEWAQLQQVFPSITEDEGKILLWVHLTRPILDNSEALNKKIVEYEKLHGVRLTVGDLLSIEDENGNEITTVLLEQFLNEIQEEKEQRQGLEKVHYNTGRTIAITTDLLAQDFFSPSRPDPRGLLTPNGDILTENMEKAIALNYSPKKDKKKNYLYYDYAYNKETLEALGIEDCNFTSYDFFVISVIDNLKSEGNDKITCTKIWHEMGGEGRPGENNLDQIAKSVQKGIATPLLVDDAEVQAHYGNKTAHRFLSTVLPAKMVEERAIIGGQMVEGYIQVFDYSPFYTIAQSLNRLKPWPKTMLSLYTGRKTPRYYAVFRYLLRQIGWLANAKSKRSHKITYSSVCEAAEDKTPRDKQLTKTMLRRILDEVFIPAGYVKSYREDKRGEPGITLTLPKPGQIQ